MSVVEHPRDYRTPETWDPQPGARGRVVGPKPPHDAGAGGPGGLVWVVVGAFFIIAVMFAVIL